MERMESDAERISFTHTILEITEQVTKAEIEQIKFLCSEHIPIGTLESMDATDIMQSLSDRRIITAEKFDFLAECLILLGRMDMADQLGCQPEVIDGYCNNLAQFKSTGGLSRFKLLLFHFADNLTKEEVKKIILYLDGKVAFPKGKMGSSFSAFDLLTFLIKAQFLHPSKLHNLTDISDRLSRLDLKERIDVYSDFSKQDDAPKSRYQHPSDQKSSDPKSANEQGSSDQKNAASGWLDLVQSIPSEKRYSFSEDLGIPAKKYTMFKDKFAELLSNSFKQGLFSLEDLDLAIQKLDLKVPFSIEDFHPQSPGIPFKAANEQGSSDQKNAASPWQDLAQSIPSEKRYSFTEGLGIPAKKYTMSKDNFAELLSNSFEEKMFSLSELETAFNKLNLNTHFPAESLQPPSSEEYALESYQMTARPRGICLIFNNEIFEKDQLKNRHGSSIDKERLMQMFKALWFDVRVFENCTKRKVQNILQDVGSMDHSKYNCFVCCILSHGLENNILAVDGEPMSYQMFTTPFKPNNCKSLSGKPKLFFIQACQGNQFQGGTSDWEMDSAVPAVGPLIPNEADFLMAHATVHGFVSFRSVSRGSWFIQNLCDVFEEHAARFDLSHLLLMVNNHVSKRVGDLKQGVYLQVPAPLSTLRKRLFFLNEGD